MKHRYSLVFIAIVAMPIAVGTAVYVGWRTPSLLVFHWMALLGIPHDAFRPDVDLPAPILYSLPDGCWVFSGTAWMLLIWQRSHPWVFVIVALALGGEFGQAVHLVPGTFEWTDVTFYIVGFVLAIVVHKHAKTFLLNRRSPRYGCPSCG